MVSSSWRARSAGPRHRSRAGLTEDQFWSDVVDLRKAGKLEAQITEQSEPVEPALQEARAVIQKRRQALEKAQAELHEAEGEEQMWLNRIFALRHLRDILRKLRAENPRLFGAL